MGHKHLWKMPWMCNPATIDLAKSGLFTQPRATHMIFFLFWVVQLKTTFFLSKEGLFLKLENNLQLLGINKLITILFLFLGKFFNYVFSFFLKATCELCHGPSSLLTHTCTQSLKTFKILLSCKTLLVS